MGNPVLHFDMYLLFHQTNVYSDSNTVKDKTNTQQKKNLSDHNVKFYSGGENASPRPELGSNISFLEKTWLFKLPTYKNGMISRSEVGTLGGRE